MADEANPSAETLARLGAQRRKWKDAATRITKERNAALKETESLKAQLAELQKGDPSGRVKELEGQLRTLKHRSAFERLAKGVGAKDKAMDTLYRESGYRADKDEPDERAMTEALERLRESHDFAFDGSAGDDRGEGNEPGHGAARSESRAITPGLPMPDAGRGRPAREGGITLTREQLADPKFMLDPRNRERIKGAKIKL